MTTQHTPTPEIFGPDIRELGFTYNFYRCDATYIDRTTGRWFYRDFSTPEQIAHRKQARAALAKVQS